MVDSGPTSRSSQKKTFGHHVRTKELRKLKARRDKTHSLWFGLGLSGLIGWSVAIPTLLGIRLGIWVDHRYPSPFSWTLMLMMGGLILGCLNAWLWLQKESAP